MMNSMKKRKEEDEGRKKKLVVDGSLYDTIDLCDPTVLVLKNRSNG